MTKIVRLVNFPPVQLALLVTFALIDLVLVGRQNDLSKSDWASWVQAVGSVIAIAGAVWAALYAASSDRRAKKEDDRAAAISHLIFSRAVIAQSSKAINDLKFHAYFSNYPGIEKATIPIRSCLATLEALFGKSDNHAISKALASAYEHLSTCLAHGETALSQKGTDLARAQVTSTMSGDAMNKILKDLEAIGRHLGAPPALDATAESAIPSGEPSQASVQ